MKTLKYLFLGAFFAPLLHAAEVAPITAEEISRLLQFDGKIEVSDKTKEVAARHGDAVISAFLFEPDDDGFSRIMVLTTKGGFLLNDAFRQKLEAAAPAVKKLDLANGGVGYVGLEGAGPGGEGYIAVAHVSEKNIDVQFKVILRNDGASQDSSEKVAKYHSILRNGSELQKALNAVLAQGVNNLVKSGDPAVEPPQKPAIAIENAEKETSVVEPIKNPEKPVLPPKEAEAEKLPEAAPKIWWQVGGLAALVALLSVWLKKRKS